MSRVVNPQVLRRYRLANLDEPCEICERRLGTDPHHVLFRSHGGGDVEDNLLWLCRHCHDDLHAGRINRYPNG